MSHAVTLLQHALSDAAQRLPHKVALVCGPERLSYGDLEHRSNALAHALRRRGVARGDRVVIFDENSVDVVVAFWAALKADAVPTIVSPQTKSDKFARILEDCRPSAIVSVGRFLPVVAAAAATLRELRTVLIAGVVADHFLRAFPGLSSLSETIAAEPANGPPAVRNIDLDLAALVYTSGSTGEPKGIMLTHRNMLTATASITTYLEMREDDCVLCVLPLSFDYGLYQMILSFDRGARLVLERSFAYPTRVMDLVAAESITCFPGMPTMFAVLGELKPSRRRDLSCVRTVTNTGAALQPKHISAIRATFPSARVYSMYGLTECKRCTYLPPEDLDRKPGSVGIPIPNTEMWIVDDKGRRLGPGQIGELVIRGATIMRGYWNKPEATARRLRPGPLAGEQVLYTGDLCKMDEEGYLYFVSRTDDLIKSRAEKVSPKEVEIALADIPGVKEAAVVGVPDELLGQAVKAFVVLERGARLTEADIVRECQARLAPFMVPKHVTIVSDLAKSPNGKIQRTALA
jgi:amino acid adenylation domain-containing protein